MLVRKIREHFFREIQLGIRRLKEEKIGEALFFSGANEKVYRGHAPRRKHLGESFHRYFTPLFHGAVTGGNDILSRTIADGKRERATLILPRL